MSLRQGIFELEQRRAATAAEIAARAKLAERREKQRDRPQLPPLPPDLGPDGQDGLMRQYGELLQAARTQPETALAGDAAALAKLDRMIGDEEVAFQRIGVGPARALTKLCEDWLRARHATPNPLPFLVTIDPELPDELVALRALLPPLSQEQAAIERAPLPHNEAQAKLAAAIAEAVAQPGMSLQPFIDPAWPQGVLVGSGMPLPGSAGHWRALAQVAPDSVQAHGARAGGLLCQPAERLGDRRRRSRRAGRQDRGEAAVDRVR